MNNGPSPNRPNGRDSRGRFAPGNRGGPGNPHSRKVAQLRSALLRAVTQTDLRAIVQTLVNAAKQGDLAAAKLLFDRLLGPPVAADIQERMENLEAFLEDKEGQP